ncbi:MAG: membrane dipeptidase [Anaerolineaceae bacterium]
MHIIIDSHEDIAWNMLTYNRDYTHPVEETRRKEIGSRIPELNKGEALLGFKEYQEGKVAVIFATLFASPQRYEKDPFYTQAYTTIDQANERYRLQLETYKRLAGDHPNKFVIVDDQKSLQRVIADWQFSNTADIQPPSQPAIGLVLLMEGAEGIRTLEELTYWWENGLRLIGPAWAGNQYCGGTREPGPLTPDGKALLSHMDDMGFTLDISHMDQMSVLQALDQYKGPIIASHANAQALLHSGSNRFLSDDVILELVDRGGVIGIVPYNHHLVWEWVYPQDKHDVKLEAVVTQIDHICQLAGDALHVGIGSDFDGGLGMQSTPSEIDTIADLQKLAPLLESKGFSEPDIANILGGNWLNQLHRSLP